jgi:hypothetical protein
MFVGSCGGALTIRIASSTTSADDNVGTKASRDA